MSVLELQRVSRTYRSGARERVALRDVSLRIEAGEHVAIWGERRSGRSTLLRVAAGMERPDEGVVRLHGRDLAEPGGEALRARIGYVRRTFRPADGRCALDQLITSQLARGQSETAARANVHAALDRTGAAQCAGLRPGELDGGEAVRVALARALAHRPEVVVIDEPALGVSVLERDGILELLHSLAREGVAVLSSAGETPCLTGADRVLALSDGELVGEQPRELAAVVPLRRSSTG